MEAPALARSLAVVNTAADAALIWGFQRTYDLPRSRRRLGLQWALGAGYGAILVVSDAVWGWANRDTLPADSPPEDPAPLIPAHESALTLRIVGTGAAWGVLWWVGRTVPGRLRRRGVTCPNRWLAPPLALGFAATTGPAWWAYAQARAAAAHR